MLLRPLLIGVYSAPKVFGFPENMACAVLGWQVGVQFRFALTHFGFGHLIGTNLTRRAAPTIQ